MTTPFAPSPSKTSGEQVGKILSKPGIIMAMGGNPFHDRRGIGYIVQKTGYVLAPSMILPAVTGAVVMVTATGLGAAASLFMPAQLSLGHGALLGMAYGMAVSAPAMGIAGLMGLVRSYQRIPDDLNAVRMQRQTAKTMKDWNKQLDQRMRQAPKPGR